MIFQIIVKIKVAFSQVFSSAVVTLHFSFSKQKQSMEDTRMGGEEEFLEAPSSRGSWLLHCWASGRLWPWCGLTLLIMRKF